MRIIRPTEITDARLISSSVPENDYPVWLAHQHYHIGDRVIVLSTHTIYEALVNSTGTDPIANPLEWLAIGPTNRWAMFDEKIGTSTTAVGSISLSLDIGIASGIAILDLEGVLSVRVVMTAPEGVVYDKTVNLVDASPVYDWWTYFFEEISVSKFVLLTDFPTYRVSRVDITITGDPAKTVGVGSLVAGKLIYFSNSVNYGASVGIQDYSVKGRDEFGNVKVVERAFSKRARWNFDVPNTKITLLQRELSALRARPAIYIGYESLEPMVVYGFYKDFDIVISRPTMSECSLDIEGLV
jgi:hypothetical protein